MPSPLHQKHKGRNRTCSHLRAGLEVIEKRGNFMEFLSIPLHVAWSLQNLRFRVA